MRSPEEKKSHVAKLLVVASCIHWEEPVSSDLVVHQCLSKYDLESEYGELDRNDITGAIASLERSKVISSVSLRSLVDDVSIGDVEEVDEVLLSDPDVIGLGSHFPQFLDVNFSQLESLAIGLGFSFDLSKPISAADSLVPTTDGFVSRDHNEAAILEVESKVSKSIELIEASNTITPEEKGIWSNLLAMGLGILKNPKIAVAGLSALLAKPLYDAYASVIEESSKPLIKSALDSVLALIGLAT